MADEKELTEEELKKAAGGVSKADTGQISGGAKKGMRPDEEERGDDDKRGR